MAERKAELQELGQLLAQLLGQQATMRKVVKIRKTTMMTKEMQHRVQPAMAVPTHSLSESPRGPATQRATTK